MDRQTSSAGYPDPIRHPHEILLGVTCIIAAIFGFVFPVSPALSGAFPGSLLTFYFIGLFISGGLILYGVFWEGVSGPLFERIGLGVSAAFFLAYSVAVLSRSGSLGVQASTLPLAYATANVVRIFQVTSALRRWKRNAL